MTNWNIQQAKQDDPTMQALYGDDQTIVITDRNGKEICWIGVAEVIESCPPLFIIRHALECVKQGVWKPDADGIVLAGEIPCWAKSIAEQAARKRKVRA